MPKGEKGEVRGPIVAGTDGSEASRLAISEAAALAQDAGRVVVVFVRQVKYAAGASVFATGALRYLQETVDGDQTIAQAQAIAVLDPLRIPWTFVVREGHPATELMHAAVAHGADTIVVAGRRHGALGNFAHGAVTADLLHRWPHSLFVVRPPQGTAEDVADSARTT